MANISTINNSWRTKNIQKISKKEQFSGLNDAQIKWLEDKTSSLTGIEKSQAQQQLYKQMITTIQNENFANQRMGVENQAFKESLSEQDKGKKNFTQSNLRKEELADLVKGVYHLDSSANTDGVINDTLRLAESKKVDVRLFNDFLQNGNRAFIYDLGLEKRPIEQYATPINQATNPKVAQGGIRGLVNSQVNNGNGILPNVSELINPLGYATETIDNAANKLADKITFTGEKQAKALQEKVNNMSDEDLKKERDAYTKAVNSDSIKTKRVNGDTIVEQLWNIAVGNTYNEVSEEGFKDWLIDRNKSFVEDITGADETLKGIKDPNVVKFFANIPASGIRTITANIRGATNPYDTIKGMVKLAGTEEGRKAFADKYLTTEGWANNINYDPVGTADDAIGVVKAVGGGVKTAGKLTNSSKLTNLGNNMSKIGSVTDAIGDLAVNKTYSALDNLAGDSRIGNLMNRYVQDTSNFSKAWDDVKEPIQKKINTMTENLLQNNNRMTKKQQQDFKAMTNEDQGKWMNDRGIKDGEGLVDYFQESKAKVDNAMAKIEGEFTSKELTTVLDDSVNFAEKTENRDLSRLQELQTKNANGGLTMSEINEVKRFYEKNNKFNYLKEGTAEKSALATNRDTALREWQMKLAEENGLSNLRELNKETQAAKFLADKSIAWDNGIKGNNPITLTDWIAFAGDGVSPTSLSTLVGKKMFSSKWFQDGLVDVMNYLGGHKNIGEINADLGEIERLNGVKAEEKIRQQELSNAQKAIMLEELQRVKNEKEFKAWLKQAEIISNQPKLGYNPDVKNYNTIGATESTPIVADTRGNAWRQGAIADISK